MQNCPKCDAKIKTVYERHGAKATYEAMGYYCKLCGILYDKELKKSASASNMLAIDAALTANGSEQDRARFQDEPITVSAKQGKLEPLAANMRVMGPAGFEPATSSARGWHPTKLDNGPALGRNCQ